MFSRSEIFVKVPVQQLHLTGIQDKMKTSHKSENLILPV